MKNKLALAFNLNEKLCVMSDGSQRRFLSSCPCTSRELFAFLVVLY